MDAEKSKPNNQQQQQLEDIMDKMRLVPKTDTKYQQKIIEKPSSSKRKSENLKKLRLNYNELFRTILNSTSCTEDDESEEEDDSEEEEEESSENEDDDDDYDEYELPDSILAQYDDDSSNDFEEKIIKTQTAEMNEPSVSTGNTEISTEEIDRMLMKPPPAPGSVPTSPKLMWPMNRKRHKNFYLPRNSLLQVYPMIRFSAFSSFSQKFLNTPGALEQIRSTIENCRNEVAEVIPEEERARMNKLMLISPQTIKESKRRKHKHRNLIWHQKLNQGIKTNSFLFQSKLKRPKKNSNPPTFIEEDNKNEIINNKKELSLMSLRKCHDNLIKNIISKKKNLIKKRLTKQGFKRSLESLKHGQLETIQEEPEEEANEMLIGKPVESTSTGITKMNVQDKKVEINSLNKLFLKAKQQRKPIIKIHKQPKQIPLIKFNFDEMVKEKLSLDCQIMQHDDPIGSYEKFRQWDKQKSNIEEMDLQDDDLFGDAEPYVQLDEIAKKAGMKIDLSILDDPKSLKRLWIILRTKNDKQHQELFQFVDQHLKNQMQNLRLKNINQRPDISASEVIKSFRDNLPFTAFKN